MKRPASFRGVPFLVEVSETDFGRRNQLHEYPKRNVPFSEDMGRKAREIRFDAFLLGDDLDSERTALMRAIEDKDTPGTLVHPTYGSMQVVPQPCRHKVDYRERRIEYFELSFAEAGKNQYPSARDDTKSVVNLAASKTLITVRSVFNSSFAVENLPQFVADDAQAKSGSMADQIKAAAGLRTRLPAESSVLAEAVTVFRRDIATLIRTPSSFSQQVASLMTQIQGVYKNPADAYVAYRSLLRFGNTLPAIAETTRTRKQQAINQKALIALSKRATLIGMARTTAGMTFESYDDAVKVRDELAGFIDNESLALGDTDDDQAYLDLQGLRASVIKDITDRAANLERVKEMIPSASLPALVTSYEIYDTANRDQEIVQRNKVQHPGYLPAGRPLQVLIG